MESKKRENFSFPDGTVQSTMLATLWSRVIYTQKYPDYFEDQVALEIFKKMDGKFSKMEALIDDMTALGVLARAKDFDSCFIKYLERYPETTVVNLGCGLDTTFSRLDNGKIMWYDLDLPEVIEYRKRFISESDRNKFIAKSVLDFSWFDDVEFDLEKGIFFMAGGLIYYFSKKQISELLIKMADHFIGGEIIFDIFSSLMLRLSDKELDKYVKQGKLKNKNDWARYLSSVDKPKKYFSLISDKLKVIDIRVIGHDIPPKLNLSKKMMLKIKIAIFLKVMKVVQLQFLS